MSHEGLLLLTLGVLIVAFLYASVGHAGASGYVAVMSLFSLAPTTIKPLALVLNILVASLASWQFWRAGHFARRLFWPFAVLSVPCAFVGGYLDLPTRVFKILVGCILLLSATHLLMHPATDEVQNEPSLPVALGVGAGIGLLSGLTGTGGGILLSPLMLFMQWARTAVASGVSAVFILVNSTAGLVGNLAATRELPPFALLLAVAAAGGGAAGAYLGSRRLAHASIRRLLATVLVIAGLKLIFT